MDIGRFRPTGLAVALIGLTLAACSSAPPGEVTGASTADTATSALTGDGRTTQTCHGESGTFQAPLQICSLPRAFTAGDSADGAVDFGATFRSIDQVCFDFAFGADDPLDPGDEVDLEPFGGPNGESIGMIGVGAPVTARTICIVSPIHSELVALFLDGHEDLAVRAVAGSFVLESVTVAITGERLDVPPGGCAIPLRVEFHEGYNPDDVAFRAFGFARVNGARLHGDFAISNDRPLAFTETQVKHLRPGDVVEVTGGFDVPASGHRPRRVRCPAKRITVMPQGVLDCGPVEMYYQPDTGTCVTTCN